MYIDHIGIAVSKFEEAIETYSKILNRPCLKIEKVESEKVKTAFFQTGQSKVELLSPTESSSVIQKFLDTKGEGIHHIAFEVDDINSELKRLRQAGFTILNESPKKGADNKLVAFVHPKNNHGVLVELCQTIDSDQA